MNIKPEPKKDKVLGTKPANPDYKHSLVTLIVKDTKNL